MTLAPEPPPAGVLRRLPNYWRLPDLPAPVDWQSTAAPYAEPHEPSFEWVGEGLPPCRNRGPRFPTKDLHNVDAPGPDLALIRRALTHAGASPLDLEDAAQRVRQALSRIRTSRRGRWILEPHEDAHSRVHAVTG